MKEKGQSKEHVIGLIESQQSVNGRYTSIQRIGPNAGDGAFSLVFRAVDQFSGKPVALKLFDPHLQGVTYRLQCFDREAQILCMLKGQPDVLQLVEPKRELTLHLVHQDSGFPFPITVPFFVTELGRLDIRQHIYTGQVRALKNLIYFRASIGPLEAEHRQSQSCRRSVQFRDSAVFMKDGGFLNRPPPWH